ncbi:MAG: hypothetical protein NTW01_00475 [Gammaproteobacteria bacterium]|nr:hypothetical protein [Gammaproteobacteria bacterium]
MKAPALALLVMLISSCASAQTGKAQDSSQTVRLGSEWVVALPPDSKVVETGGAQLGIAQYTMPGLSFWFRVHQYSPQETPAFLASFYKANIRGAASVLETTTGQSPRLYWFFKPSSVEGVLVEAHGQVFGHSNRIEYFAWASDPEAEQKASEIFNGIEPRR